MAKWSRCPARLLGLVLVAGCEHRTTVAITPATSAYRDGFEVVVFDIHQGSPTRVRSLPLREAEQALAAGAQAAIPGRASVVEQQLKPRRSGDSRPVVLLRRLDGARQRITLGFHESNATFRYEYEVDGTRIRPIRSEIRNPAGSKVVQYLEDLRNDRPTGSEGDLKPAR